ncbi:Protein of unknown function [Cotesia congregata]|uniref:Uncharacterized protein n=1 Tax=Cotesia congregata TaxID=51543 RepID=A0A8J2HA11_COTCN|nr:Protein of unknown function [Cotesia congregata]
MGHRASMICFVAFIFTLTELELDSSNSLDSSESAGVDVGGTDSTATGRRLATKGLDAVVLLVGSTTGTRADNFANYDTSLESVSNKSSEDQKINLNTTVKPPEEPKLPEDLISQDVLLDPNIVLARLSRDLRGNYQPYYGHSSNYWPSRRISSKNIHKKYRGDNIKRRYEAPRIKIYPVFPGK